MAEQKARQAKQVVEQIYSALRGEVWKRWQISQFEKLKLAGVCDF